MPGGDGILIGTSFGEVIYVALPSYRIISVYQQPDAFGALLTTTAVAGATFVRGSNLAAFVISNPVRFISHLSAFGLAC